MKTTLRIFVFVAFCVTSAGCSWFGGNDPEPEKLPDVCANKNRQFVTQFPNGLGVTSEDCASSARGEWIEGRCYCHGSSDLE